MLPAPSSRPNIAAWRLQGSGFGPKSGILTSVFRASGAGYPTFESVTVAHPFMDRGTPLLEAN
jgi:hypothetical protein